jgi:hypothetical protein
MHNKSGIRLPSAYIVYRKKNKKNTTFLTAQGLAYQEGEGAKSAQPAHLSATSSSTWSIA